MPSPKEQRPRRHTPTRFKMLTRWLTFTALLAVPANPGRRATGQGTMTVAPTCRVKGHLEVELTLHCGDGKDLGVVQYWHTPFGDLHTPGSHSKLDPVVMHHDGSLLVPNTSALHSGLYYCLLQHTEGTTLWPYELHVGHDGQNLQELGEYERSSHCAAFSFRRDAGSEEAKQAGVSAELFAGAVAASVLLTFVLGFSIGALSRTHVFRCLGAVRAKLRSPKRGRKRQSDTTDHRPEVSMTTLPPTNENPASENDQVVHNNSATNLSPPAKPQRSFRHKREEDEPPETTAYLEGCDYKEEKESRSGRLYLIGEDGESQSETDEDKHGSESREEKKEGRCAEDRNKGSDKELEEGKKESRFGRLYLIGEDEESLSETDEDKHGSESREEKMGMVQEEEEAVAGEEKDGETEISRDSEKSSFESEDEDTGGKNQEVTNQGALPPSPPRPARRSRVIRLYQYDEDGQRYGHLPDPGPDAPLPAPRFKQRSVSLTRLSAIMAAASTGPLDQRQQEEG
ncbi:C-C motif chemokine 3 [Sarotherodon galilaeus]